MCKITSKSINIPVSKVKIGKKRQTKIHMMNNHLWTLFEANKPQMLQTLSSKVTNHSKILPKKANHKTPIYQDKILFWQIQKFQRNNFNSTRIKLQISKNYSLNLTCHRDFKSICSNLKNYWARVKKTRELLKDWTDRLKEAWNHLWNK